MEGSIVPIVAKKADELSKPFSGAVAGTLAEFWNGIVGDRVVAWRLKNAAKVSEMLEKEMAERGLTLKTAALPESYAYRWFEKASEEDEPELQALFAKLLANAATGNEAALQRQNIDLLSRMTPDAARFIAEVARIISEAPDDEVDLIYNSGFDPEDVWKIISSLGLDGTGTTIDILKSIGVISDVITIGFTDDYVGFMPFTEVEDLNMYLTSSLNTMIYQRSNAMLSGLGITLIDALFPR